MKVREIMTSDPVCCVPEDTTQKVAQLLREHDVGSLPVVAARDDLRLVGMVTDRDICLAVVAEGADPKTTTIENCMTSEPAACREGENLNNCERLMEEHQVRRIPVVDGDGKLIGIVAQADIAQKEQPEKVKEVVAEISKPETKQPRIAA
jgi:CBS domain-containing protein